MDHATQVPENKTLESQEQVSQRLNLLLKQNRQGQDSVRPGFLTFHITDTRVIEIFVVGAVLHAVGCVVASLASSH